MAKNRAEKKPKIVEQPRPVKHAKWASEPTVSDRPLGWRFSGADKGGPYSWSGLADAARYKEVLEKLHEFEMKTWAAIKGAGSHPIARESLCKDARDRLASIKQDDLDELMSFRVTGTNRVWCIQHENIMRVLWWDPEHAVYPVEKDKADREKRRRREGR